MNMYTFNTTIFFLWDLSFILVGVVLIVSTVKYLLSSVRFFEFAVKLPGPIAYPIVGNALTFACKPDQLLERIISILESYADAKPIRLWMGPKLYVIIIDPRDIEIILNSPQSSTKGSIYRFFYPFIGNGLISGSGKRWKTHRKMLSHLFNQRTLETFVNTFDRRSSELVDKLRPLANGEIFDIFHHIEGCTIDICCETIMGRTDVNALSDPNNEFIYHTAQLYEIVYERMLKVWLHPDWIFKTTERYGRQQRAKRVINRFTEQCIEQARKNEMSHEAVDRTSILRKLLSANEITRELNDEDLRDEIYTVYIAAQDTLALTSCFAILMLGIHKNVQDKARNEINRVIGERDELRAECLSGLKYIEMVVKETLRLFPVGTLLARRLKGELKLDKNCILPEGCEVVVACYGTHRSPKYWDKPNEFVPERFDPDQVSNRHPYAFIPFSGGPMGCIGKNYAVWALKTILINILRKYIIKTNVTLGNIKLRTDISIRSVDGYKVSLESIQDVSK